MQLKIEIGNGHATPSKEGDQDIENFLHHLTIYFRWSILHWGALPDLAHFLVQKEISNAQVLLREDCVSQPVD